MSELPMMAAGIYSSSHYKVGEPSLDVGSPMPLTKLENLVARSNLKAEKAAAASLQQSIFSPPEGRPKAKTTTRFVQTLLVDPDENVPLEKRMLYSSHPGLTDMDDQELFFSIDIKSILDDHNAYRTTLTNKKITDRTVKLEPTRIRDLKMTVVTIASF